MIRKLAFFITPHGFGHATRALAVMEALLEREDAFRFEIFSRLPGFLINQSIGARYRQHLLGCDVGLAQESALAIDLPETVARLKRFLPFDRSVIKNIADQLREDGCLAVVCDISPMGLAVAERAGLPSFLIENFTWDWIYGAYLDQCPELEGFIQSFGDIYQLATYRIQTEPVGLPCVNTLTTPPVSRKNRLNRSAARELLDVRPSDPLVVITMGGFAQRLEFLDMLGRETRYHFVIPGLTGSVYSHVRGLPKSGGFFHPDLMEAADTVIAKLGYSTVAEVYQAGVPLGYIERPDFRESPALAHFIRENMPGISIRETHFHDGSWLKSLDALLDLPRSRKSRANGADQIASFILDRL